MVPPYSKNRLVALSIALGAVLWMDTADAVDGVVLINQQKALAGEVTPGDAPGFPVTISRRGSYRLSSELRAPQDAHGIHIRAEDVTIDLNGFTVRGPGSSSTGNGIWSQFRRTTVSNGVVRSFAGFGLLISHQSRITDLHVEGNSLGGIVQASGGLQGSIVSGNTVTSNGGPGIRLLGSGDLVVSNTLWMNSGIGISAGSVCVVRENAVSKSGSHGIFAANGCLVTGNTARENGGFGMFLDGDAGFKDNVFTENNGGSANPQVSGGIQLGTNICGGDTICP
jgi:parallel beta-helix repeat protein